MAAQPDIDFDAIYERLLADLRRVRHFVDPSPEKSDVCAFPAQAISLSPFTR